MSPTPCKYIAIDVSKDTLLCRVDETTKTYDNNAKGHGAIIKLTQASPGVHVVLEATGGYERDLMQTLWDQKIPVSRVEPSRIRAFARSEGIKAKNDPIDALMIQRYAQAKAPDPTPPPSAEEQALAAWMDRRQQLIEEATRQKNRIQNCPQILQASHKKHLQFLEKQIATIEAEIAELMRECREMAAKQDILIEVVGVAAITSQTLLAFLPEIGQVKSNHLNSLAGLAPYPKDSGKKRGRRSIQGGRARVRRCLYMAAVSASMHNPVIRDHVARLVDRGIPKKSALVSAMRKLLHYLNLKLKREYYAKISLAA